MNVLDEFKNYKRKFIQISHRTAILMHIFEKSDDDFEDIILSDHEEYYKQNHNINIYKEAANQFFKQFEGNECLCFVECLRDKCNEMLEEHKDKVQKLKPNKYDKNLFKRYHELKQDITKYYNLLQEYKTTYDNFILGLENESNSNQ